MSREPYTGIPVKPETRDRVRSLKRGGEDYDTLIQKMINQYEPESTTEDV